MKKIVILGSTGSIGESTLQIAAAFPGQFQVVGLSAAGNIGRLKEQAEQFKPEAVAVADPKKAGELKPLLGAGSAEVLAGGEGIEQLATLASADVVVSGIVGAAGLLPTLAALKKGKRVALANKEVLVMAGALVRELLDSGKGELLPVDSEHSALFQALGDRPVEEVRRLILTASGGPFLHKKVDTLNTVTPEEAVNHPRWKMGPKISVDSATMMNKGLEVIEAKWLFGIPAGQIEIVVHPESIAHSFVEFVDGSMLAQLGVTDMKIPIQYALTYPEHTQGCAGYLDLAQIGRLNFLQPDFDKFSALKLAYQAAKAGGTAPCVLNAANEVAVDAFLQKKIGFLAIIDVLKQALDAHQSRSEYDLEEILELDCQVRKQAWDWIEASDLAFSSQQ